MTDYARLAATAQRLIAKRGAPVVLTRRKGTTYDAKSSQADSKQEIYTGKAVQFDYTLTDVDGTLVQVGDARLMIGTEGMVLPETGDKVTFDGDSFSVITGKALKPATIAVVYEAQVRKD